MFEFKKERFNKNGSIENNQLYVEYGMQCQCKCEFCRNNTGLRRVVCLDEIDKTIRSQYSKCRRIIFGGGEPLFELPRIMNLIEAIKTEEGDICDREKVKFQLITNGDKALFEKYLKSDALRRAYMSIFSGVKDSPESDAQENQKCSNCHLFDKIILSRHHYDDSRNQEIFNSKTQLLCNDDFKALCTKQKMNKIQLNCVCQRGGIDSIPEVMNYIRWAFGLGFTNILFSNLESQTTPDEYFSKKSLPYEFWDELQEVLNEMGMETREKTEIYTSAGYKTTSYYYAMMSLGINYWVDNNDECIISVKEYCDFDNKVASKLNNFNFEGTVRADGSIDWPV